MPTKLKQIVFSLKPVMIRLLCKGRLNVALPQKRWQKRMKVTTADNSNITIGADCCFRSDLTLHSLKEGSITIGSGVFMNKNVSITAMDSVYIGDRTKIANNVVIIDHDHDYNNQ